MIKLHLFGNVTIFPQNPEVNEEEMYGTASYQDENFGLLRVAITDTGNLFSDSDSIIYELSILSEKTSLVKYMSAHGEHEEYKVQTKSLSFLDDILSVTVVENKKSYTFKVNIDFHVRSEFQIFYDKHFGKK